jgi:hypothetical protein
MSNQNNIINKEEFSFLPTLLSIFEKIYSDDIGEGKDDKEDKNQKIKEQYMNLLNNIEKCKSKINDLPGIENSNVEQIKKYDEEIKVVNQKRNQFIHYLNMPIFKKFYNESDIKQQTELATIQEKLEEKDKEKIKDIKKRNNIDDDDPMDIENSQKKIKTEIDTEN